MCGPFSCAVHIHVRSIFMVGPYMFIIHVYYTCLLYINMFMKESRFNFELFFLVILYVI